MSLQPYTYFRTILTIKTQFLPNIDGPQDIKCSHTRVSKYAPFLCIGGNFNLPRTNLRLSVKAFCVVGPWNSLPTGVRSCVTKTTFCKHLKTHLFDGVSYGHIS